jgi:hypothetical protein
MSSEKLKTRRSGCYQIVAAAVAAAAAAAAAEHTGKDT